MDTELTLRLALEDVLAQLWHARRNGELGRLAHLGFSEVQRWARSAQEATLVANARELLGACPYRNRDDLVFAIDRLIDDVEFAHSQLVLGAPSRARDMRVILTAAGRH
jgi:hypothetical protein